MKEKLTELVFVLDRSGSMNGLERDTIGGFNAMIEKQKKEAGHANVTTVLFDDQIEVIHDRFPIEIVEPLTGEDYYVRGCTALLDAVGSAVKKMENIQRRLPDDRKAEKVVFVIITDGHENSSVEYSYRMVKQLIEQKQEIGWQFLFLGANIDAAKEAENMGIRRSHAVNYRNDSKGVKLNFEATSRVLACLRQADYDDAEVEEKIPEFFRAVREHKAKGEEISQ